MNKEWDVKYLETKNGYLTVEVEGYLLHSKYNPLKENQKKLAEIYNGEQETIILFGVGLGYILKDLKDLKVNFENILIIDPLAEVLTNHVLNIEGFEIFSGDINKEILESLIREKNRNYNRIIKVLCAPNYNNLFLSEYKILLEAVKNVQEMNQVRENTTRQFSQEWQRNYIYNILNLKDSIEFNNLIDVVSEKPIVVASGGPSLMKQIELLKKYRNKMVLIASGSTVNTLLAQNIEPDYVVSIDGGDANYRHFENLGQRKMKLIYSFSSHYKIPKEWKNEKYPIFDLGDDEFASYVKKIFDINIPLIPGGASVANYAFSCAMKMSQGPVALIGQDLAYTNGYTHAPDNKNTKMLDEQLIMARGMFEAEGYYGGKVLTDKAFWLMKTDFEHLYKYYSKLKPSYNCTEGGLQIELMPKLSFEKFCEKYMTDNYITEQSNNIEVKKYSYDKVIVRQTLQKELYFYDKVIKQLEVSLAFLRRSDRQSKFNKKILLELDKTDKMILRLKEQSALHHILDPLILDIMNKFKPKKNESSQQKFIRVYNQNMTLYYGLLDAIKQTKKYMEVVLEEL